MKLTEREQFWLKHCEDYSKSELTFTKYCLENNLNYNSFRDWIYKILPSKGYKFSKKDKQKDVEIKNKHVKNTRSNSNFEHVYKQLIDDLLKVLNKHGIN